MHQYLGAIGFEKIQTKADQRQLLKQVIKQYSYNELIMLSCEDYTEYKKKYGNQIGIVVCGEMDKEENFYPEYHFPYLESRTISSYEEIVVNRKKDSESFMGIFDDMRIGVSIIFYLQNPIEYMKIMESSDLIVKGTSVSLAALALKGTVLLPVAKVKNDRKYENESSFNRKMMVAATKFGDVETMDAMEQYFNISDRIKQEDVFSIVDTYFIPYGIECDEYSILGEIKALKKIENQHTHVELYHMLLEINEMEIELCVPVAGVLGEPEVGRRFKSSVWLQGKINFPE